MRIFLVHEDIYNAGNPYIYTLKDEIQRNHSDIEFGYGIDEFWSDNIFSYNIVHFQWPQAFMAISPGKSVKDLKMHLERMHSHNVRIVATCHDLKPHYNQCAEHADSMLVVYAMSDVIFHLGEYSQRLFEKDYPLAQHLRLPHHIFDTVYTRIPKREDGIKHLRLNPKKQYILSFGAFRANEERQLLLNVAKRFRHTDIEFIAPAYMSIYMGRRYRYFLCKERYKRLYIERYYHIHMTGDGWCPVADEDLPYYYAASSLCFIQRKKILNSGNAVLPFLFDKVVVGPDVGNVGSLLREVGYPTFNPDNMDSVIDSINQGLSMNTQGIGATNHERLMNMFSTVVIAERLYRYYKQICD